MTRIARTFNFSFQLSEFQFFHLPAMTTFIHFLKQPAPAAN
jgi:hypothetical protein